MELGWEIGLLTGFRRGVGDLGRWLRREGGVRMFRVGVMD